MGKVIFNMTVSVDGFVAGPNDSPENGLGDGGGPLFNWYFNGDTEIHLSEGTPLLKISKQSAELLQKSMATYGAGIWGRKTFDIAHAWGGNPPWRRAFILTHHVPQEWAYEGSAFTFVTDGVESAVRQAKEAAGDKDVVICTASILQQALNTGLVDELHLDVAPMILGQGVRLFDHLNLGPIHLERIHTIAAPNVTHMAFGIVK